MKMLKFCVFRMELRKILSEPCFSCLQLCTIFVSFATFGGEFFPCFSPLRLAGQFVILPVGAGYGFRFQPRRATQSESNMAAVLLRMADDARCNRRKAVSARDDVGELLVLVTQGRSLQLEMLRAALYSL